METFDVVTPRTGKDDKTRWSTCGVAFVQEGKKTRILLDTLPIADKNGDCVLILAERKKHDGVSKENA